MTGGSSDFTYLADQTKRMTGRDCGLVAAPVPAAIAAPNIGSVEDIVQDVILGQPEREAEAPAEEHGASARDPEDGAGQDFAHVALRNGFERRLWTDCGAMRAVRGGTASVPAVPASVGIVLTARRPPIRARAYASAPISAAAIRPAPRLASGPLRGAQQQRPKDDDQKRHDTPFHRTASPR